MDRRPRAVRVDRADCRRCVFPAHPPPDRRRHRSVLPGPARRALNPRWSGKLVRSGTALLPPGVCLAHRIRARARAGGLGPRRERLDYARAMSATRSPAIPTGAERTLNLLERQIGRSLSEVETPVAVIDLDRLDVNLRDLQSYVDSHGIELWPHTKTHKSPEIGRRQLELGAGGLTVAKTGEAQVFQEAGAPRILVHYPPFGADKWERLVDIAASGVELTVAVDSVAPAEGLARALDRRGLRAQLLVEIDVGLHRTGRTTAADAVALAQELSKWPAVEVAGISCYPGHLRPEDP